MAIAYDNSVKGSAAAASITVNITTTNPTLGLAMVEIDGDGADACTGVTWAGSAMTRIATAVRGGLRSYIYGILSPTTGAQNVIASAGASVTWKLYPHSYTGTDTTTLPSVTATAGASSGAVSAVLTAGTNNWVVGIGSNNFANNISMDAGHPFRQTNNASAGTSSRGSFDTNGTVTGSDTATFTPPAGTGDVLILDCAIAPPSAVTNSGFLMFM